MWVGLNGYPAGGGGQMRYGLFLMLAGLGLAIQVAAGQEARQFLYGTVTTKSGEDYSGPLRWDDEEILWTDHFNALKTHNEFLGELAPDDLEFLENRGPSRIRRLGDLMDLFSRENRFSDFREPHAFVCRFGDIASLMPTGDDMVRLELRNGESMLLADNSNDLGSGTTLQVYDAEAGLKKIRWQTVASVRFGAAPEGAATPWGAPLYGSVQAQSGAFNGFIQWDHDERVGSDVLDGELEAEDISIAFADIAAIVRSESGSKVTLKTGETLVVTGSNDVNEENRGLYVELANGARMDVPWSDFTRIVFTRPANPAPGYQDFAAPVRLTGSVMLRDDGKLSGRFAFDLDEAWDIEMLNGRAGILGYAIPFRHIARIEVLDEDSVRTTLADGSQLLLAHDQDVSERNDGLLVFGEERPRFVRWLDVAAIDMQRD